MTDHLRAVRFAQLHGTPDEWTQRDPILEAGEIGVEEGTGRFKIGDGVSPWHLLSYFMDVDGIAVLIQNMIEGLGTGVGGVSFEFNDPRIGNMLNLTTVAKDTLVNVINEIDADTTPQVNLTLLYDNAKAG